MHRPEPSNQPISMRQPASSSCALLLLLLACLGLHAASAFLLPSSSSSPAGPQHRRAPTGVVVRAAADGDVAGLAGKERLKRFLEDAAFLGPIRFVVVGDGAILESVGSFEGVRYNELPRGEYATCASDDKSFEAHINLDKVVSVEMVQSKAKKGDHDNYIIRFKGEGDATLMSAMLHREEEQYDEDAVSWFNKLKGVFGESQRIQ